ncbi:hypothetical protein C7I85_26600 [Mesorhizobium soli]|uniref:Uncharacterized protein n=1 Tax=Pseudaminobacter soli (ex Li et al. 2025) TaxID=1295366 RepID=A0A2P7RZL2_9HYPH|nr:hypothetical protein C7I85_26600 [Mesorhizobium soli]
MRAHAREWTIGAALLAGSVGILLFLMLRFDSPVVKSERVEGTIVSVAMIPQKSYGEPTSAISYQYIVSLGDNETVVAADQISRPHPAGSSVKIERRTRANGTVTFHIVPSDCVAPECVVPFNQQF